MYTQNRNQNALCENCTLHPTYERGRRRVFLFYEAFILSVFDCCLSVKYTAKENSSLVDVS